MPDAVRCGAATSDRSPPGAAQFRSKAMSDIVITCPQCGHTFPLSDALAAQLAARFDADHQARLAAAVREAENRAQSQLAAQLGTLQKLLDEQNARAAAAESQALALRQKTLELEQAQAQAIERARLELEARLRAESEARARELVAQAETRARNQSALEVEQLQRQLAEEQARAQAARARELELTRQAAELARKQQELDLELERRLAAARSTDERRLRELIGQEQSLKLAERDKQIEDMKKVIDELQRKSQQGSQELQGEVLELDIEAALRGQFPHDHIAPVPKGVAGADLIQEVRSAHGQTCGRIVWETKNTKHWSPAWLGKLKDDTRAVNGSLAVLVSTVLPEGVHEFGLVDGVWVASRRAWPALAVALREQLVQVAFAHAAAEGKQEKMDVLYRYLAGDDFRHKVGGIVEAFTALQEQLARERRAMERIWKEREKQIERVILNTVGMYGEMRGILGGSLPEIPALGLDEPAGLLDDAAAGE
jgi:hypothetical protein